MNIDWTIVATIAPPLLAVFIGVWLNRWFENRPKLVVYYGHVSEFDIKPQEEEQQEFRVHTHAIVVSNTGNRPAKNVRVGHAFLPTNFKVLPIINHHVEDLPGGGKEIVFPNLVPKKQVTISYLYYPPLTWNQINTHVESDEGSAKVVEVLLTPQISKRIQKLLILLILTGATTVIYIIYLVLKNVLA